MCIQMYVDMYIDMYIRTYMCIYIDIYTHVHFVCLSFYLIYICLHVYIKSLCCHLSVIRSEKKEMQHNEENAILRRVRSDSPQDDPFAKYYVSDEERRLSIPYRLPHF